MKKSNNLNSNQKLYFVVDDCDCTCCDSDDCC